MRHVREEFGLVTVRRLRGALREGEVVSLALELLRLRFHQRIRLVELFVRGFELGLLRFELGLLTLELVRLPATFVEQLAHARLNLRRSECDRDGLTEALEELPRFGREVGHRAQREHGDAAAFGAKRRNRHARRLARADAGLNSQKSRRYVFDAPDGAARCHRPDQAFSVAKGGGRSLRVDRVRGDAFELAILPVEVKRADERTNGAHGAVENAFGHLDDGEIALERFEQRRLRAAEPGFTLRRLAHDDEPADHERERPERRHVHAAVGDPDPGLDDRSRVERIEDDAKHRSRRGDRGDDDGQSGLARERRKAEWKRVEHPHGDSEWRQEICDQDRENESRDGEGNEKGRARCGSAHRKAVRGEVVRTAGKREPCHLNRSGEFSCDESRLFVQWDVLSRCNSPCTRDANACVSLLE